MDQHKMKVWVKVMDGSDARVDGYIFCNNLNRLINAPSDEMFTVHFKDRFLFYEKWEIIFSHVEPLS